MLGSGGLAVGAAQGGTLTGPSISYGRFALLKTWVLSDLLTFFTRHIHDLPVVCFHKIEGTIKVFNWEYKFGTRGESQNEFILFRQKPTFEPMVVSLISTMDKIRVRT